MVDCITKEKLIEAGNELYSALLQFFKEESWEPDYIFKPLEKWENLLKQEDVITRTNDNG